VVHMPVGRCGPGELEVGVVTSVGSARTALGGRREASAAVLGVGVVTPVGAAKSVRAVPAASLQSSSSSLGGRCEAAAVPEVGVVASVGSASSVRACPAAAQVSSHKTATTNLVDEATTSLVEGLDGPLGAHMPVLGAKRSAPCPVVPLEVVDELRAPGAGSLAAGRPAPGFVPEASDSAAAAARRDGVSGGRARGHPGSWRRGGKARACISPGSTGRPYISCGRCRAISSSRLGSPSVLPPARARVPEAPAGLAYLAADAEPGHLPGCGRLRCCCQRVRKGGSSIGRPYISCGRAVHAIGPDVVTYSAAASACESATSTGRPCISCGRC